MLKHLFTPKEAEIASKLSNLPKTVSEIYRKVKHLGISKEELETHLDEMDKKGSIFMIKKGKRKFIKTIFKYSNSVTFKIERDNTIIYLF